MLEVGERWLDMSSDLADLPVSATDHDPSPGENGPEFSFTSTTRRIIVQKQGEYMKTMYIEVKVNDMNTRHGIKHFRLVSKHRPSILQISTNPQAVKRIWY